MKKFWQLVATIYLYFAKRTWLIILTLFVIVAVEFVLIFSTYRTAREQAEKFEAYQNVTLQRINQIYSHVFAINSNVNKLLEKNK